jgi:hypothetical protein
MHLNSGEREFLAVFIGEATTDPFNGPATSELHRRDIYYTDIPQLLTAYYRESSNEQDGLAGKHNTTLPACPWQDRAVAVHRNREVGAELNKSAKQTVA